MTATDGKFPTVSVLVSTRNRSAFLVSTLNDICAQDFPGQIEILVSDNASTDDTASVLPSYPREAFTNRGWSLRTWRHEKNIGIVDNFRFLLEQATGQYIAFHLDDDRWMPDYVRCAIQGLIAHPQCNSYLTANLGHTDECDLGPGWLTTHRHPLTGRPPSQGVHTLEDVLPALVSRPACNLSQLVFAQTPLRPDMRDGAHFDLVFMASIMARGKVYVDHQARCSFRGANDAYGRKDVLANQALDNMEYSYAFVNLLAKLQAMNVLKRSTLSRAGFLRATKSLIHFVKATKSRQFCPEFINLASRLALGSVFGWSIADRNRFSAE